MSDADHTVKSPFPFVKPDKKTQIVDERCTCGHPRSTHEDTAAYGHGPCWWCEDCIKFTWKSFIEEDIAQLYLIE